MSIARRVLGLPAECNDWALLGVTSGRGRDEIILAARMRLARLSHATDLSPEDLATAQAEVRAAAQRLVLALPRAPLLPRAPVHKPVKKSSGWESMRAMILLRRDPRRARMFHAMSSGRRAPRDPQSRAEPRATPLPTGLPKKSSIVVPESRPERAGKVSRILVAITIFSLLILIVEILVASGRLGGAPVAPKDEGIAPTTPAVSNAAAKPNANPASPATPASPASPATPANPRPDEVAGAAPVAPRTVDAPKEVSVLPSVPKDQAPSERPRPLLNEWQHLATSACDATDAEFSNGYRAELPEDALMNPLRQLSLLERLLTLHGAAADLIAGNDSTARMMMDTLPRSASAEVAPRPASALEASDAEDGKLEASLRKFPGSSEGRAGFLRAYRTRSTPPGPIDSRTLVHEALKGPNRAARTIALTILIDRGASSLEVLDAVEERFAEIAADSAFAQLIRILGNDDGLRSGGTAAARGAIVERLLSLRGSRTSQIDAVQMSLMATLARVARAANQTIDIAGTEPSIDWLVRITGAMLHETAARLGGRSVADITRIQSIEVRAASERAASTSAIGQAIANVRGLLALDAVELALASPLGGELSGDTVAPRVDWQHQFSDALIEKWSTRLEALSPKRPEEYLLLAEDVIDASQDPASVALASQLAALAGALDAKALGSSAAILLAALATPDSVEGGNAPSQWRAVARKWSESVDANGAPVAAVGLPVSTRMAIVESIAIFRRGLGRKATERLKDQQYRDAFEAVMSAFPGGAAEFERLAAIHVRGEPIPLDWASVDALLRVERALLAGSDLRWSDAITLGANAPMIDVPMGTPAEVFSADPARSLWRSGKWSADN